MAKCKWIGKESKACMFNAETDSLYCKSHSYVANYTEEQKKNVKYCNACRKVKFIESGKSCSDCKNRSASVHTKKQIDKQQKQQDDVEIEEDETTNWKICSCCKKKRSPDEFIGVNGETIRCKMCRARSARADAKRSGRDRDYKEYESRPERKEKKKEWTKNNKEKTVRYYMENRARDIEKLGLDGFREREAKRMQEYRAKNLDAIRHYQRNFNKQKESIYKRYVYDAEKDGKEWKLNEEMCYGMFYNNCFYCGEKGEEGDLNGIDRLDHFEDYTIANTVSCCSLCNYIKHCLDPITFVKRCEHILTFNNEKFNDVNIYGKLNYKHFPDHNCATYKSYEDRAKKKGLAFELSIAMYDELTAMDCYICGKENSISHSNGIDRLDNEVGYIVDNCYPCCGECNYMKKNLSLEEFFVKIYEIYENKKKILEKIKYRESHNELNKLNNKAVYVKYNPYCIVKNDNREKFCAEKRKERNKQNKIKRDEHIRNTLLNPEHIATHSKKLANKNMN